MTQIVLNYLVERGEHLNEKRNAVLILGRYGGLAVKLRFSQEELESAILRLSPNVKTR